MTFPHTSGTVRPVMARFFSRNDPLTCFTHVIPRLCVCLLMLPAAGLGGLASLGFEACLFRGSGLLVPEFF